MSTRKVELGTRETRTMSAELRTMGDEFSLIGYAATFNSWSKDLGGFREKILPGAFTRSLNAKADVKALFNHDPSKILGRTLSGTLTLSTDAKGLRFRCQLDKENQSHRDLYASIKRGDISECSFAFSVAQDGDMWVEGMDPDTNQRTSLRTLKDVDLLDVSAVTNPAYDNTAVGARHYGYGKKSSAIGTAELDMLRQSNRSMVREKPYVQEFKRALEALSSPYPEPYTYDFARKHMELCSAMAESAWATADTLENVLDQWPEDDDENDSRSFAMTQKKKRHRAFRDAHREAHTSLEAACRQIATTMLHLSRVTNKTSSTGNGDSDD